MTAAYVTGTITLTNGSTAIVGTGTGWETAVIAGGVIYPDAAGNALPIQSVNSDTSITTAVPWRGASGTYAYALIRDTAYGQQTVANAQALATYIARLDSASLAAVAALGPALTANKLPYFAGPGTAALADFKEAGRQFLADDFTPIQQGGGPGQLTNKLRIGWTGARLNAQVDGYDQGSIWTDAAAPGALVGNGYQRLPHGLMFQWGSVAPSSGSQTITFPLAFAAILGVLVTPEGGASGDTMVSQWVSSKSTTSFVLSTRRAANGGLVDSIAFPTKWLAIGSV